MLSFDYNNNYCRNQSWALMSQFAVTRHRVIDAKAKFRWVTWCREFKKNDSCRVLQKKIKPFWEVGGSRLLPFTTSPASCLPSLVSCLSASVSHLSSTVSRLSSSLPPSPLYPSPFETPIGGEKTKCKGWKMTAG